LDCCHRRGRLRAARARRDPRECARERCFARLTLAPEPQFSLRRSSLLTRRVCRERRMLNPVMFPPGRARLWAKPRPTGSPVPSITTGIVVVAFLTASTSAVVAHRNTSASERINRVTSPGNLSGSFSANCHSITIFRPTTYPASRRPSVIAARYGWSGDTLLPELKNPIRGIFPACCASVATGAASTAPSPVMKARRFIAPASRVAGW